MTLFETIAKVQPTLPGWCPPEKAEALAAMVVALRPLVTVEIGVYGGSSFFPLALAHKHIGYGTAIGIDPWSKAEAMRGETAENAEWARTVDYETLYNAFMGNLQTLGLEHCTKIIRQTSDNAPVPNVIDLLHIDGNHQTQAVKDVIRFAPKVRPGGLCVMDDLSWENGQVQRAAQILQHELHFKLLYPLGTGATYQRIA